MPDKDDARPRVVDFAPTPMLTVTIEAPSREPATGEIHLHAGGQGFWAARLLAELDVEVAAMPSTELSRNTGHAILHSGTVGAALSAATFQLPAVAVSLGVGAATHWDTAAEYAGLALDWLLQAPAPAVLNVNVPNVPHHEVIGFEEARLAAFGAVQTTSTEKGAGYVKLAYEDIQIHQGSAAVSKIGVLLHQQKTLGAGPEALRMSLADAGYADPPWSEVPKSRKAPKQVRRLLDAGIDRLLVWGGDGTVRRCIDTLVKEDADVELAILPAGTANLLAKALGIPVDLDAAVDVALHGLPRRIDVGVLNGETFAVMAGTGFDALMIRDADDGAKERLGRISYVKAAARHLGTAGAEATIRVDGQPWFEGRAACVLIGNVGRILGGIHVFPDALPDDGLLDVGVVTASGSADWLRVGTRALFGSIGSSPFVDLTKASTVKIRLDRTMPWEIDGGDQPRAKSFKVSVLPQRQAVCVPAS